MKFFLNNLKQLYGRWLEIPSEIIRIEEFNIDEPDKNVYENYSIISQPVLHTHNSLAYRINTPHGKSVVYSGDTGYCDNIIRISKNADLLMLECALPDNSAIEGHLTPTLAALVASRAQVKKLLLLHFYPEILETDFTDTCRKHYQGELILGRDLLRVSF